MSNASGRAGDTSAFAAERIFFAHVESATLDDGAFEELCANFPDHAAELRRLRSLYDRGQALVRGLEREIATEPRSASDPVFAPSERYRVLGSIAAGGMGAVLEAYDSKLRRALAIKVLRVDRAPADPASDPRHLRRRLRLLNEAQTLASLEHPAIVPIYDVGRDERGELFFTMLRVRGQNLDEVFASARAGRDGWSERRLVDVLVRVCEAMAHAHQRGVVHRDLKPANVMVGPFGEVYVMDWGLAKTLAKDAPSSSVEEAPRASEDVHASEPLTLEGEVLGTPSFMAPEQARGAHAQVGPAADVYALGAIVYCMLAGRAPYQRSGEQLDARAVLARVLEGPPPPLAELAPRAPRELIAISERAMQRDPNRRYRDVGALLDDLRAYLDERPGAAWRDSLARGAVKLVKRRPAGTIAVFASVLIAVVALFGYRSAEAAASDAARLRGEKQRREFVDRLPRLRASDFATRLSDESLAARTGDARAVKLAIYRRDARDLAQLFDECWLPLDGALSPEQLAARLASEPSPELRAAVCEATYALLRRLGACGAARASAALAEHGGPAQLGGLLAPFASEDARLAALWPRALAFGALLPDRELGARAVEAYASLSLRNERPPDVSVEDTAKGHADELEMWALMMRDVDEESCERLLRAAIEADARAATCHLHLARLAQKRGELASALPHVWAALAARPHDPTAHCYLGVALRSDERVDEGIARLERALELDPDYYEARVNLASWLYERGELRGALAHCEYLLARAPDDADTLLYFARTLRGLAAEDATSEAGQLERAESLYARLVELDADHETAWRELGKTRELLGDSAGAQAAFARAAELDARSDR